MQRYLSMSSVKNAKKAIWWNLVGLWCILSLTLSIGLLIFAKYQSCDPILNNQINLGEQLFPLFVMDTLRSTPGLPGLFLACVFSAALSTISSGLNSLTAVFLEDVLKCFFLKNLTQKWEVMISKLLCVIFGVVCLGLTFVVSQLGSSILQAALSLFGVIGGPILGLFFLALFVPFSNAKGAIIGTLTSLAFLIWLFLGFNIYGIKYPKKVFCTYDCIPEGNLLSRRILGIEDSLRPYLLSHGTTSQQTCTNVTSPGPYTGIKAFHSISYVWYGSLAVLIVLIVGSIVSLLTGPLKPGQVDPSLLFSLPDKLLPFLPIRIRRILFCGFSDEKKVTDSALAVVTIEKENAKTTVNASETNQTNLAFQQN